MQDTVDVLLATFNGEEYIDEQVLSLEKQTMNDFNILISDDGSTDLTIKHIHELQLRYPNVHVIKDHPRFGGAKGNFLFLTQQTQAQYAMFCDQDDYWLPSKIELTYKKMKQLEKNMVSTYHYWFLLT
ncbi:glycosyltransferase [Bifidobacterium sp. ESL0682]|uniref:glycosyltransferase n=1 Tax=Bifidobacterium sp. ESL0682 TaxID=2983212 RepID=UPI0023F8066E|nr:glycosyltransferase [Bifidobacterium sp. ESL0682]WEV42225.1 glycosyltransferase [Bifidobacterium sp. ESL0682]